jgi:hypothetical protein
MDVSTDRGAGATEVSVSLRPEFDGSPRALAEATLRFLLTGGALTLLVLVVCVLMGAVFWFTESAVVAHRGL